uniref:AIF family member 3 n=1 Tax=Myripristis murdjan TaxID=586833 RepID=A0A667YK60_9TELE
MDSKNLKCLIQLHTHTESFSFQHRGSGHFAARTPPYLCVFDRMREVDLGSGRALLIKEHGEFSAMGHKCPHYGAPLVKGVLSKGHVRCPWHGACFNIATGDIEDFPGLDSLPTFQVTFPGGKVPPRMWRIYDPFFVVNVSTGPAGLVCAETLRQEGFTDRIVMCTMDKHPPYDRPKLSKVCTETLSTKLRQYRIYQECCITECRGTASVNNSAKTGALWGTAILHHSKCMTLPFCFSVLKLKEVVLKSGKVLRADVCVIGAGEAHSESKVTPIMMQTNVDGVFAGGDVVMFPFPQRSNKKVNIPHWQMAHVHGRVAALSMMGRATEIKTVPYFWSAMFGKSIRYAGYGDGFDDVIIQGDLDELRFVAFYTRSEEVVAVASMNYDPIVSRVAEVLGSGKTIKKTGDISWLIDKGSQ